MESSNTLRSFLMAVSKIESRSWTVLKIAGVPLPICTVHVNPSLTSTTQTCISLSFKALLLTHWIACILMISTTFAIIPTSSWLGTYGYCQIVDDTSDVKLPEVECVETGHLYLMVFKWSLAFVFHNGFSFSPQPGPYEPYYDGTTNLYGSKLTDGEEIVIIFLKLFGIGFWSLTISKLIRSITVLGNPALIAYQQDVDSVNRFCTFNRLLKQRCFSVQV